MCGPRMLFKLHLPKPVKFCSCRLIQTFVNACNQSIRLLDLNSIFRSNNLLSNFCLRRDETARWKIEHSDVRCRKVGTNAEKNSSYPASGVAREANAQAGRERGIQGTGFCVRRKKVGSRQKKKLAVGRKKKLAVTVSVRVNVRRSIPSTEKENSRYVLSVLTLPTRLKISKNRGGQIVSRWLCLSRSWHKITLVLTAPGAFWIVFPGFRLSYPRYDELSRLVRQSRCMDICSKRFGLCCTFRKRVTLHLQHGSWLRGVQS